MLKPLKIGTKTFDSNLIQAPLAGISCAPFRALAWQFGDVAYCCTEMLSAHDIAKTVLREPRFNTRFPEEKILCWQLSGNNPEYLAKACDYAIANGANILDLNCGCPQPKIRKKGCGSQLLSDAKKLSDLVKSMRRDSKIPVTVKMRISAEKNEFCDITIASILEDAGVDAITVHGRHWTHDYDTPCQIDSIAAIAANVKIPVIGNGDITDSMQLQKFFDTTHCAGFMIGRASVGQPWIYKRLTQEINQKNFQIPSQKMIGDLFLHHVSGLISLEGEQQALFQSRKLGKYYARELNNKSEFLIELYKIMNFSMLTQLIHRFF